MAKTTPMMLQYNQLKEENRDSILFFRLGDFYEMFKTDAEKASRILGLTLTRRNGITMCGIPYHAAKTYIPRLLKAGQKIAICEQTQMPENGKGIAKREVVEVITPGTVLEEDFLDSGSNNYILAVGRFSNRIAFSYCDLSTGDFFAYSTEDENWKHLIRREITRLDPRELIIQETLIEENDDLYSFFTNQTDAVINRYPDWSFDVEAGFTRLIKHFKTNSLKAFGFVDNDEAIACAGLILSYIEETSKSMVPHIRVLSQYCDTDYVRLDDATIRNLELVKSMHGNDRVTLMGVLDFTHTAMGKRQLRGWILNPLSDKKAIENRQAVVNSLYHDQLLLSGLEQLLSNILDMQRLSSRLAVDKAHAKDLRALGQSITQGLEVVTTTANLPVQAPGSDVLGILKQIADTIEDSICETPSIVFTEGRLISRGYNDRLDELHRLKDNSSEVLDTYVQSLKEETGIQNLKIKYNKIIGYFLEVSKSNLAAVPDSFIRRQSLVNGDRFTTERLNELETEINSASEKIIQLEKELFFKIRDSIKKHLIEIAELADYSADIDVFYSLARAATVHGYTQPRFNKKGDLCITNGRHPVVEKQMPAGRFVPNSLELRSSGTYFALITGPNMAGKSTYLRQNALITLMAQMGSFVPAEDAQISIVDRIFCRVGASDNLAQGESTFLVEMNEAAFILQNASPDSLVIMDEVGRGTSTNDGLSIARAISEHLLNVIASKTLFATHYHELTDIEHSAMENLSMAVAHDKDDIVFLKRVQKGASGNSYGIHVAKLAGLPAGVIQRAGEILEKLSIQSNTPISQTNQPVRKIENDLFSPDELVLNQIRDCKPDHITPMQALELLYNLKKNLL